MSESFLELTEGMIADGYHVRFHANGLSMTPTINDGEAITVEPVDPLRVRCGDILLYRRRIGNPAILAHRVRRLRRGQLAAYPFVMRGDASAGPDEQISVDDVLGRVRFVERDGRTLRVGGFSERQRWRFRHLISGIKTLIIIAIAVTRPGSPD